MCSITGMDVRVCVYVVVRKFMATNDCDFGPRIAAKDGTNRENHGWDGYWVQKLLIGSRLKISLRHVIGTYKPFIF